MFEQLQDSGRTVTQSTILNFYYILTTIIIIIIIIIITSSSPKLLSALQSTQEAQLP